MSSTAEPTRMRVSGATPYDVVVGHTILGEIGSMLGPDVQRVALCSSAELDHLADRVVAQLKQKEVLRIELPNGEAAKNGRVVLDAWEQLGDAGFTRSDAVVTVGGGAISDIGGFIAATWLRGIRVVHVPTTVLGMVDAAVGGKTGMNTGAGKNLVGSFHEPAGVLCDLDLLHSLSEPELISGLGEVVKCGFIADPKILRIVEARPSGTHPGSSELRELVERAIRVKIEVVVDDLREVDGGDGRPGREVLNYGHTFAHAIEKNSCFGLRHGEAVALGMVYAAQLARLAGLIDEELAARHAATLGHVGLPTRLNPTLLDTVSFEDVLSTMRVDKKTRGSHLRFVVLHGLAEPAVLTDPPVAHLRAAYDHLGAATEVPMLS